MIPSSGMNASLPQWYWDRNCAINYTRTASKPLRANGTQHWLMEKVWRGSKIWEVDENEGK